LYCACKSGQTLLSRSVAVSRIASGSTAAQFHQPGKRAVLRAVADGVRSAKPSQAEPSRAEPSRAEPSRAEPSRAKHATVGESIDRPAATIGWGHSALTGMAVGCLREHALQQVGYDGEHRLIGTRASIALDTLARLVLLQHRAASTDSVRECRREAVGLAAAVRRAPQCALKTDRPTRLYYYICCGEPQPLRLRSVRNVA
jgi:hypothetical protein